MSRQGFFTSGPFAPSAAALLPSGPTRRAALARARQFSGSCLTGPSDEVEADLVVTDASSLATTTRT